MPLPLPPPCLPGRQPLDEFAALCPLPAVILACRSISRGEALKQQLEAEAQKAGQPLPQLEVRRTGGPLRLRTQRPGSTRPVRVSPGGVQKACCSPYSSWLSATPNTSRQGTARSLA